MRGGAAVVVAMVVCLLAGAPASASVAAAAVIPVTVVDAAPSPTPVPSPIRTRISGPGPHKPGWVWWAAGGLAVLLGAGAVRFWLAGRDAGHVGHHQDRGAV